MAIALKALPVSYVVHFLAVVGAILVLIWNIGFRGGLAWESSNKNLIFNVLIVTLPMDIGLLVQICYLILLSSVSTISRSPGRSFIFGCKILSEARMQQMLCQSWVVKWKQKLEACYTKLLLHPVLMLIGFIIIGGEAIISYKSLPLKKPEKKLIHLVLHAIALILGIIGIYTAFKFHNESNIANLYSLHSWLGIGVISLYGIQWVYGFLIFFYPGGTTTIRSESLPWHVLFGIFVYVLAVGTAALGYLEKLTFLENSGLAKYGSEAFLVNFTAVVTILYGTFVILTILSQAPPEDEYSYSAI